MTTDTTENTKPELPNLETLLLKHGAHNQREQGVCLLEAVAWFAGEDHTDHPACVDIALGAYGRSLNDRLKDDERQVLRPLILRLVGTAGSRELAKRRAFHLVDRYFRSQFPAFLRELPFRPRPDLAQRFEALPPVVDGASAYRARDLAREVRADIMRSLPAYADAAAAADAAAGAAADAAAAFAKLRQDAIARAVTSFVEAIELTEAAAS